MLLTAVWLELLLLALIVWVGFVRANSYFRTSWLRWLFVVPAWLALGGLSYVLGFHEKMTGLLDRLQPLKELTDILVHDRATLAKYCAIAFIGVSAVVLVSGLSCRTDIEGNRVPRARKWRWSVLVGAAVTVIGAIWGEAELVERRLRSETESVARAPVARFESTAAPGDSIPDEQNAAVLYRRAFPLIPSSESWYERWQVKANRVKGWDGEEHLPLTPEEVTATDLIAAAGERPDCSFGVGPNGSGITGQERELMWKLDSLLLQRMVLTDDATTISVMLTALRDLSNHQCRDPGLSDVYTLSRCEIAYLAGIAKVMSNCPEKLSVSVVRKLLRDDEGVILGGFERDAASVETAAAEAVSKLFQTSGVKPRPEASLWLRLREKAPIDENAGSLGHWAMRVRRTSNIAQVLDVYRDRIDRFERSIAATKKLGYTDWSQWRDLEVTTSTATPDNVGDLALKGMLESAYTRYSLLSARRVSITVLAAAHFRQDKGRLPTSLAELTPAYLPHAPIDAMFGKPIGLKGGKDCIYVYAPDHPTGRCGGLEDLERPGETRNMLGLAVRILARLPAGGPSAKLPNPQP